jgi:uncharacterized protein
MRGHLVRASTEEDTMTSTERWFHGHLREVSRDDCLALLGSKVVGRVAFCEDDGPTVIPVNFVVDDGTVLFRTGPHTAIARHVGQQAAFEVDESDEYTESGWSVLVRGHVEHVDVEDLPSDPAARPMPWPEGARSLYLRIVPREITGRRLLPA